MSILQKGRLSVVLGAQWGDEGKGKLSDILCGEADVCARCAVSVHLLLFLLPETKRLSSRVVTTLATPSLSMMSSTTSTCCLLVNISCLLADLTFRLTCPFYRLNQPQLYCFDR